MIKVNSINFPQKNKKMAAVKIVVAMHKKLEHKF